jgi:hypothetical protein
MTEKAELSALSNHRFYLFRVFNMGGSRLMTNLARDPNMIAFFFARCDCIMTCRTGIGARIFYRKTGILLRRGSAVMSVEPKIRGHKEIMGEAISNEDDRQRNQEVAYLLGKALP